MAPTSACGRKSNTKDRPVAATREEVQDRVMRALPVLGLLILSGTADCAPRHLSKLTMPSAGAHRLADGGCVDFQKLPSGWLPVDQAPIREAAAFAGRVQGVAVRAVLHTDGLYTDVYAPTVIGWRRLPSQDVRGFAAWMADDGELVLADGGRKSYSVIIECEPENTHAHTPATCHVSDHHLPRGRLLEVQFGWNHLKEAQSLISGAEQAADRLPHTCPA